MLTRLVYASAVSAGTSFTAAELAALLTLARANNASLGVSGMLLYHQGSFLQVLEGERNVVQALYERIAKDKRHTKILLLGRFDITEPAFGEWSMGALEIKAGATGLDGLNEFLKVGTLGLQGDHELVERVLRGFRDGRYRQHIR